MKMEAKNGFYVVIQYDVYPLSKTITRSVNGNNHQSHYLLPLGSEEIRLYQCGAVRQASAVDCRSFCNTSFYRFSVVVSSNSRSLLTKTNQTNCISQILNVVVSDIIFKHSQ